MSICAWCHSEYDPTGQPIRKLTDQEYDKVVSHGICNICKDLQSKKVGKK